MRAPDEDSETALEALLSLVGVLVVLAVYAGLFFWVLQPIAPGAAP